MTDMNRVKYLKAALIATGLIFIFGIYTMMILWPAGWGWEPRQGEYEQMIIGFYATLGVFLLIASRDPMAHKSLIWFTICSSIVHASIMLFQALVDNTEQANLMGDIPALFLAAALLWFLMPKQETKPSSV